MLLLVVLVLLLVAQIESLARVSPRRTTRGASDPTGETLAKAACIARDSFVQVSTSVSVTSTEMFFSHILNLTNDDGGKGLVM